MMFIISYYLFRLIVDGYGMKRTKNLFMKGMNNWISKIYINLFYSKSSKKKINQEKKVVNNEILKIDLRTGYIHYRKQHRPLQKIIKTKDNTKITLDDVIR